MRVATVLAVASFFLTTSSAASADDPVSGPKVGNLADGFEIELATGDQAGTTADALKALEDKPVIVIFVNELTRPGFRLLKLLDQYARVRQPEGLEAVIVWTTDDAPAALRRAKLYYDQYDVKSTAGVAKDGKSGPKEYGLNDEAAMTVLLLDKRHKVLLNLARRAPDRQDFDEVRKAIDKLLGPSPVPFP